MTKQSNRSLRPRSLWIAMLATLAFAGAGQALAPAPAVALHTEACADPQSGLCNPVDDSPVSGDSSSGESKGSGGAGGWPFPTPPPSAAPWSQPAPWNASTQGDGLIELFRYRCGEISADAGDIEAQMGEIWDSVAGRKILTGGESHKKVRGIPRWVKVAWHDWREMYKDLRGLEHDWYDFSCTELGI